MKRIISCILSVILVVCSTFSVAFYVGATENSSFAVGTAEERAGNTVEIPIEIKNNPGITSFRIIVEYDTVILKLTNVSFKDAAQGFNTGTSQSYDSPYSISGYNSEVDISNNGQLAVLTFEISASAEVGEYPIILSYDADDVFNMNGDNIAFEITDGFVNVVACIHSGGEWEYLEKETCTESGIMIKKCEICGEEYERKSIDAKGHSFKNNNPVCSVCGAANPNYVLLTQSTTEPATQPTAATAVPVQDVSETQLLTETVPAASSNNTTTTTTAAKAAATQKPKASSVKKLSKGKKQFKVTWKKVSGVSGYQVQYATDKKFKKNKKTVTVKGAKNTSKTVKNLKSKKTYYVRVRTYKTVKVNGKATKVYSGWSKAKSVKTK